MKQMFSLIFPLFLCILMGCGPTARSSGLLVENIKRYGDVKVRIPRRVLILSDGNVEPITNRAHKIFTEGLRKMGFEVVDPKPVYDEFNIEDLSLAMQSEVVGSEEIKKKSEEIKKSLADKFGIEGVFTPYVHSDYLEKQPGMFTKGALGTPPSRFEEMGGKRWFTRLHVFLYQIPKGYTLWKCNTEEHLFESTWEASIEMTTEEVLRHLDRDTQRIRQ